MSNLLDFIGNIHLARSLTANSLIIAFNSHPYNAALIESPQKLDFRLTQAQLCELYQTSKSNISEHIKHIFEDGELMEDSVVRKFLTTAADGKTYNTL